MSFREKFFEYLNQDRRKSFFVPQIGETVYFSPVTVLEIEKIRTVSHGDRKEMNLWMLIEKAEDEKGNKIFTAEDKPFLERGDFQVIYGIADEMMRVQSVEETKKNSEMTPSE
jgi:hypothetical protein